MGIWLVSEASVSCGGCWHVNDDDCSSPNLRVIYFFETIFSEYVYNIYFWIIKNQHQYSHQHLSLLFIDIGWIFLFWWSGGICWYFAKLFFLKISLGYSLFKISPTKIFRFECDLTNNGLYINYFISVFLIFIQVLLWK